MLVAGAALLALAGSEGFVDNLNQESDSCRVDLIQVHGYFIGISVALPAQEHVGITRNISAFENRGGNVHARA